VRTGGEPPFLNFALGGEPGSLRMSTMTLILFRTAVQVMRIPALKLTNLVSGKLCVELIFHAKQPHCSSLDAFKFGIFHSHALHVSVFSTLLLYPRRYCLLCAGACFSV